MNNLEKAKELHAAQVALQLSAFKHTQVCIAIHYPHEYISSACYTVKANYSSVWYEFSAEGELLNCETGEQVSRELCKNKLMEFLKDET
jgi:hypothetical protein